jgi:hypothetical protein
MPNFVGPQKFVAKHKLFQNYFPKHTPSMIHKKYPKY